MDSVIFNQLHRGRSPKCGTATLCNPLFCSVILCVCTLFLFSLHIECESDFKRSQSTWMFEESGVDAKEKTTFFVLPFSCVESFCFVFCPFPHNAQFSFVCPISHSRPLEMIPATLVRIKQHFPDGCK